jgi:hypothetical protein
VYSGSGSRTTLYCISIVFDSWYDLFCDSISLDMCTPFNCTFERRTKENEEGRKNNRDKNRGLTEENTCCVESFEGNDGSLTRPRSAHLRGP